VPRISSFYGIVISMNWKDHPPPHCHARYAEYHAKIDLRTGEVLAGYLPPRALRLIRGWVGLHRNELLDNWQRSQAEPRRPLARIEALQ